MSILVSRTLDHYAIKAKTYLATNSFAVREVRGNDDRGLKASLQSDKVASLSLFTKQTMTIQRRREEVIGGNKMTSSSSTFGPD